ncbi:UNVERIFIED_ORG: hypothetical protein DFO49_5137 [Herbaspirillum seropedicae]
MAGHDSSFAGQQKVFFESLKEQDLRIFFTQITPESPNPNSNNGLPQTVSRIFIILATLARIYLPVNPPFAHVVRFQY